MIDRNDLGLEVENMFKFLKILNLTEHKVKIQDMVPICYL